MKRLPLTPSQDKLMNHLYYDEKYFFGRDKLWRIPEVQEAGITRRQVASWLEAQQVSQMFKQTRASRDVQPTIASKPYGQMGCDLMDLSAMADNGFKWILTCIDLFSKKGFAVPMKDKTESSTTNAMRKMLKLFNHMPAVIRSDNGSEFICAGFKKLLADHDIKQVLSAPGKPQSNGQVERFNGVLKRLIKMNYLYTGTSDWATDINQYLHNYNTTYQRVIGMSPDDAEKAGEDGEYEIVHERIRQNVLKRHPIDTDMLSAGDKVRVKLEQDDHEKQTELWSRDTYTIKKVFIPRVAHRSVQYSLDELDGRWYNNDLQKITSIQNPIKLPETYIISKIVRPATRGNVEGYIIRWKNYKPTDDTFEPRENLLIDIPKMIEKFDKEHKVEWVKSRGKVKFSWSVG